MLPCWLVCTFSSSQRFLLPSRTHNTRKQIQGRGLWSRLVRINLFWLELHPQHCPASEASGMRELCCAEIIWLVRISLFLSEYYFHCLPVSMTSAMREHCLATIIGFVGIDICPPEQYFCRFGMPRMPVMSSPCTRRIPGEIPLIGLIAHHLYLGSYRLQNS